MVVLVVEVDGIGSSIVEVMEVAAVVVVMVAVMVMVVAVVMATMVAEMEVVAGAPMVW